jgi:hypothetical protein
MGWSQSRVSKLETGRKIASEYEINAWTRAVGADERTAEHLRQLRQSALMERLTTDPSDVGSRGDDKPEPELHFRGRSKLDASVRMVAEYHPSVIPLLLSTGQHAVELARRLPPFLETDELPGSALNELALWRTRSQDILYSPTCRVEIILNEAALHTRLGSLAVTVAQLDRLLELCAMQMVDIGIIPATQPAPVLPISHFSIREPPRQVVLHGLVRDQVLTEDADVDAYLSVFAALRRHAVRGDQVIEMIKTAKASFQHQAPQLHES